MTNQDVFQIISTTRAMRRLKPDPLPDDMIVTILEAAVCAPNSGTDKAGASSSSRIR